MITKYGPVELSDLIARGLIDEDHRLTDAGNLYVEQLIALLKMKQAPKPARKRVKWNRRTGPRVVRQQSSLDDLPAAAKLASDHLGSIQEGVSP